MDLRPLNPAELTPDSHDIRPQGPGRRSIRFTRGDRDRERGRDRETERQRHRETERQRQRQRDREREREREKKRERTERKRESESSFSDVYPSSFIPSCSTLLVFLC